MDSEIDLARYFERISDTGSSEPTLATLHALTQAHTQAIPFENLDVLLGRPIALEPGALFQKLVCDRRGGYCFEQNGLFLEVLSALGFRVRPLSARVRLERARSEIPPRTHVFLRVELDGESWLSDVGVGALSLTSALRLDFAGEQPTSHEPRRILREDGRLYHQVRFADAWHDVCEFTLEEMPAIDRKIANFYTSTHPESHFKNRLLVARALPAGRRVTVAGLSQADAELTLRAADGSAQKQMLESPEQLLEALAEHFGLRFPPGTRFPLG